MSIKTIIVDFDNTIADTAKRIVDFYPKYNPLEQRRYTFEGEFKSALDLYGRSEFYDQNLLLLNWQVVEYIKKECIKEETRILFISSCMTKETVSAKIDFLERFRNNHFSDAFEVNYEMIRHGLVTPEIVYEYFNLYKSDKEIIAIDDYEGRLRAYVDLNEHRPNIVAVRHPYSEGVINKISHYVKDVLSPNYKML